MSDEPNDLEARKNELFATITLLAGTKRDLIGVRGQRRLALIERQAQLEADKERLSHEVNAEYMYHNLQAFMNRVDTYDLARTNEAKETHSGIAALSAQFRELADDVGQLKRDMRDSQEDRQTLHAQDTAILKEIADLRASFEEYKAGSRRSDVDEIKAQLAELHGEYTPEQRARLTTTLLKMIAEYEAEHQDGA